MGSASMFVNNKKKVKSQLENSWGMPTAEGGRLQGAHTGPGPVSGVRKGLSWRGP